MSSDQLYRDGKVGIRGIIMTRGGQRPDCLQGDASQCGVPACNAAKPLHLLMAGANYSPAYSDFDTDISILLFSVDSTHDSPLLHLRLTSIPAVQYIRIQVVMERAAPLEMPAGARIPLIWTVEVVKASFEL